LHRISRAERMKPRTWLWLLLAASSGCRDASAPRSGAAPRSGTAPIQTDAAAYQLEAGSIGYAATIRFVFTNPRQAPVYVVNCGGTAPPALEEVCRWSVGPSLVADCPLVLESADCYRGR